MKKQRLFLSLLIFILGACVPSVQYAPEGKKLKLSEYKVIFFKNISADQNVFPQEIKVYSYNPDGRLLSETMVSTVISDADIAEQTATSFAFELEQLGFSTTTKESEADAIVTFSLGPMTYRAFGWRAAQVIVRFIDPKSGEAIIAYRVKNEFQAFTPNELIHHLTATIWKHY